MDIEQFQIHSSPNVGQAPLLQVFRRFSDNLDWKSTEELAEERE
jgi:hypothetical protein